MDGASDRLTEEEERRGVDEADYANYFCTYEFLYHQKEMLEDGLRMNAYHDAVMRNAKLFEGRVVLDVGCGSGILAIWSAQAGARRVYAVEATRMAKHARTLMEHNKLENVVTVLEGTVESLELPEQVDIIISEWMGYFLLRESMLDSVLHARDKWLRPGGMLFPSHATLYLAPIVSDEHAEKADQYDEELDSWEAFVQRTQQVYGVDFRVLGDRFENEQRKYFLQTSRWTDVKPSALLGEPCALVTLDLSTVTVEELKTLNCPFKARISEEKFALQEFDGPGELHAFCGWFDVDFRGSSGEPAAVPVKLTTQPVEHASTHWGQQVFHVHPAHRCMPGDVFQGKMRIQRNRHNQRLLDVWMDYSQTTQQGECHSHVRCFYIE